MRELSFKEVNGSFGRQVDLYVDGALALLEFNAGNSFQTIIREDSRSTNFKSIYDEITDDIVNEIDKEFLLTNEERSAYTSQVHNLLKEKLL